MYRLSHVTRIWSPVLERWHVLLVHTEGCEMFNELRGMLKSRKHYIFSTTSAQRCLEMCKERRYAIHQHAFERSNEGDEVTENSAERHPNYQQSNDDNDNYDMSMKSSGSNKPQLLPLDEQRPFDLIIVEEKLCSDMSSSNLMRQLRISREPAVLIMISSSKSTLPIPSHEEATGFTTLAHPVSMTAIEKAARLKRCVEDHRCFMPKRTSLQIRPDAIVDTVMTLMMQRHSDGATEKAPLVLRSLGQALHSKYGIQLTEALFWLLFCKNFQQNSDTQQKELLEIVSMNFTKLSISIGSEYAKMNHAPSPKKIGQIRDEVLHVSLDNPVTLSVHRHHQHQSCGSHLHP